MRPSRRLHRRLPLRALVGAVASVLVLTATAAANPADLRELGATAVQGGGYWGIELLTDEHLIAGGYRDVRVMDEPCTATPAPTALVFATELAPDASGDGDWVGLLTPVGPVADQLAAQPGFEGQVVFEPLTGGGTRVTAYLERMPDGQVLRVCVGIAGS